MLSLLSVGLKEGICDEPIYDKTIRPEKSVKLAPSAGEIYQAKYQVFVVFIIIVSLHSHHVTIASGQREGLSLVKDFSVF